MESLSESRWSGGASKTRCRVALKCPPETTADKDSRYGQLTFQDFSDVDNESTWLVADIAPLLVRAPDLQTRDGDGEQHRGGTVITLGQRGYLTNSRVTPHPHTAASLTSIVSERVKHRMSVVAFSDAVSPQVTSRLYIIVQPIVRQFQHLGQQFEQSAIHAVAEVLLFSWLPITATHVTESSDFVHEWLDTFRLLAGVDKLVAVEIEMLDSVRLVKGCFLNLSLSYILRLTLQP